MVSVIVPFYKDWERLAYCLASLQKQDLSPKNFEVLLVNNDPSDTLGNDMILSDNVRMLVQEKPGSYAARNRGIINAKANILAFLDSDCIPAQDWLSRGLKWLNGADLVGGKMEFFKEKNGNELAYRFEKAFSFDQKKNVENGRSITANLFVKKSVLDSIGLFPETFLSGGDYHWTRKASSKFRLVYGEDVLVLHPARQSVASLKEKKKRTAGGMYVGEFGDKSLIAALLFILKQLRPPVTVLVRKDLSPSWKWRLFFLKWYLEWVGVRELLTLRFNRKVTERS